MDNVNILLWIIIRRCCFISVAVIVQPNGSRWFHIESSSSMRFLVPRSRPLEWVIVKVQASNQDSPDWVTVQQLHTLLFPANSQQLWLSTVILYHLFFSLQMFVVKKKGCLKITFHEPLWIFLSFQNCDWLINVDHVQKYICTCTRNCEKFSEILLRTLHKIHRYSRRAF